MSETNVPAIEADSEVNAYELAFHVLPTIAEGEVASVVEAIKTHITAAGGSITSEEAPARFELAYEIDKYLEGRNRKFASAYFGWVRFTAEPAAIEELAEEVEAMKELLRTLLIKLTKVEAVNPFMFHESIDAMPMPDIEAEDDEEAEDDDGEEAVIAPEDEDGEDQD